MKDQTTSTNAQGSAWWISDNVGNTCSECGKPYVYIGDVLDTTNPPYCTCTVKIPSTFDVGPINPAPAWQLCPRCNGNDFYEWDMAGNSSPCRICDGTGLISTLTGRPPKHEREVDA